MPGKPKHYTPEFKEQAVKKVVDSSPPRTITEVARELNINDTTLGFWVKAYRKKLAGQPLPSDMPDDERVRELERRVRELEAENVFLKKAAAYFAREHRCARNTRSSTLSAPPCPLRATLPMLCRCVNGWGYQNQDSMTGGTGRKARPRSAGNCWK